MDPIIEEMQRVRCRQGGTAIIRSHVWLRYTAYLRDVIQPQLDEREALKTQVALLQAEASILKAQTEEKRGPGRPRKIDAVPA